MIGFILFISGTEIIIILFVAFILFGTKRLPEIARGLGKGLNEIKKVTGDLQQEIMDGVGEIDPNKQSKQGSNDAGKKESEKKEIKDNSPLAG